MANKNGNKINPGTNIDPDEVCQICGGLGVVTMDVPVGHPDFGKAFTCVCQADKVKSRKTVQLRALSNLDVYANKTFSTFQVDYSLLGPESDPRVRDLCSNAVGERHMT